METHLWSLHSQYQNMGIRMCSQIGISLQSKLPFHLLGEQERGKTESYTQTNQLEEPLFPNTRYLLLWSVNSFHSKCVPDSGVWGVPQESQSGCKSFLVQRFSGEGSRCVGSKGRREYGRAEDRNYNNFAFLNTAPWVECIFLCHWNEVY